MLKIDYQEMVREIADLTTVEGFVSTCLGIKESMLFYDHEIMLAAYSSTVELVVVSALFYASLKSEEVAQETEKKLESQLQELEESLMTAKLPLDVQNLGEQFLRGPGMVLRLRYPMYQQVFRSYRNGEYQAGKETVDQKINRAQRYLYAGKKTKALKLIGVVGAMVLRGARLRPFWFRIGHPTLQLWLAGIQTTASNFAIAPYFNFPFEEIKKEKQKRAHKGHTVIDLGGFRNLKHGIDGDGFTDRRIAVESDRWDQAIETVFASEKRFSQMLDEFACDDGQDFLVQLLGYIGEAGLWDSELSDRDLQRVLRTMRYWTRSEGAALSVKFLEQMDPWDGVFLDSLRTLQHLGSKALPAMRRHIRREGFDSLSIVFANLIASGRRLKSSAKLLLEIYANSQWNHGREFICMAVARFGGEQMREFLTQELQDASACHAVDATAHLQQALANLDS